MKTNYFLAVFCLLVCYNSLIAQQVSELNVKLDHWGQKPSDKMSKNVYISDFQVMVEVYREDVDYKKEKEFRGIGRGEATAQAALGLKGVDAQLLQAQVDKLYSEFVADLKAKGYTLIDVETAAKTDYYKNAERMQGPNIRESANPGYLEILPSGASFMVSKREAEGKSSNKAGIMGNLKMVGKAVSGPNQLSKDLNDALIIEVKLALNFSEAGSNWFKSLSGANAQVKTNLMLGTHTVQAPKTKGLRMKGQEEVYTIPNTIEFYQGAGLKKIQSKGYLKKPVYISGVIDDTKSSAYDKGASITYTNIGDLFVVKNTYSTISTNAKFAETDGVKLADGLYKSASAFLNEELKEFFD
ncbi:hypothetical protein [Leeuwenhoekiella sp. MAR_2009_132]|uniref:hypothetical protein n=1 Tax=Leeuwenhoekiella sp. MAR_2009_132 TaxID=1392489 RepID=UPI00048AF860|nr:hypothetical protein [Leeuwenhoekiella sp. MAR_2009_132]